MDKIKGVIRKVDDNMDKIKGVIRKVDDIITAVKLQKLAQDSELLKDVYGTILTDLIRK